MLLLCSPPGSGTKRPILLVQNGGDAALPPRISMLPLSLRMLTSAFCVVLMCVRAGVASSQLANQTALTVSYK